MKPLKLILLLFTGLHSCSQQTRPEASSVVGVFVASTPCSQGTRPVPGMAVNADCEFMKWQLTLYQDASTKTPTTYKLHCVYGSPRQGTTGLTGGGKEINMEGNWTIVKGAASDRLATVYQLHDTVTNKTISFLQLNDHLLHLLDSDQHLMIGSAAWSYTLNRIDKK